MNIHIDVVGMDGYQAHTARQISNLKKAVNTIIKKSIYLIERYTKIEAPVITGRLRASIGGGTFSTGSFPAGEGIELFETYGSIGPTVEYAKYVEPRRQFMKRGVHDAVPYIKEMAQKEVNQAIK